MRTWIAAAAALALADGLAAAQDEDQARKIDRLIEQLGAEDYPTREKATEELRKIGKPAEPELRKAAESADPEVQSRARALLKELEKPKEPENPRDEARRALRLGPGFNFQVLRGGSLSVQSTNGDTTYRVTPADGSAPFTFHKSAGGSVKIEYTDEKGERKSAESESLGKFLKDHKALAERFGISESGIDYKGLRAGFDRGGMQGIFRLQPGFRFQLPGRPQDDQDNWNPWPFAEPPRGERAAGATLEKPSDTLRAHLEIPEGQGAVVMRVAEGSDAEAAGLRKHDIILEIDGQKVGSPGDVKNLLRNTSSATVLRKGQKRTLRPKAGGKSDF